MTEKQHIPLAHNDVMLVKGRLDFARRLKLLNQNDNVCRDCITAALSILHGPVPGADLN